MRFLIRSFFSELKNDSATALTLPAVATPAHAIGPAEALPVVTAVLAALIAMYDNLAVRFYCVTGLMSVPRSMLPVMPD